MQKRSFLLVPAFLTSFALGAQKLSVEVNYIASNGNAGNSYYYQPNQLISWDDFKGRPLEANDAAALTNAGFGLKLMIRRLENVTQLVINVNCGFSRKDSWVKPGYKTTYILNHEQKHFDIAYFHTLLFIQKLKNARLTNANYAAVIEKIYNETTSEMSEMQNQYDAETSHSRIPEKQSEWDQKISKQLLSAVK